MALQSPKEVLHNYLRSQREGLRWKLEGLSERDARYPMTGTGTNLLGVYKHAVSVEAGYLGEVFDRPFPEEIPWLAEDAQDNADMWATPAQTIGWMHGFADRVWAHGDATIEELELSAEGRVPWWPGERARVSLHQILVHLVTEYARHLGHADIVRELIDGRTGLRPDNSNLPPGDADWWRAYVNGLKHAADAFEER